MIPQVYTFRETESRNAMGNISICPVSSYLAKYFLPQRTTESVVRNGSNSCYRLPIQRDKFMNLMAHPGEYSVCYLFCFSLS